MKTIFDSLLPLSLPLKYSNTCYSDKSAAIERNKVVRVLSRFQPIFLTVRETLEMFYKIRARFLSSKENSRYSKWPSRNVSLVFLRLLTSNHKGHQSTRLLRTDPVILADKRSGWRLSWSKRCFVSRPRFAFENNFLYRYFSRALLGKLQI